MRGRTRNGGSSRPIYVLVLIDSADPPSVCQAASQRQRPAQPPGRQPRRQLFPWSQLQPPPQRPPGPRSLRRSRLRQRMTMKRLLPLLLILLSGEPLNLTMPWRPTHLDDGRVTLAGGKAAKLINRGVQGETAQPAVQFTYTCMRSFLHRSLATRKNGPRPPTKWPWPEPRE